MITSQDNVSRGKDIEVHLSNVIMELSWNIYKNRVEYSIQGKSNL